jgi:hypothetical protein
VGKQLRKISSKNLLSSSQEADCNTAELIDPPVPGTNSLLEE